jgi:hypothetical protein
MMTGIPLRAALYLRVSTARQAEHDVSIPDQKRQGEAYCLARGYRLHARNPKVTPARVVSGPTLLAGICFCANCGGAMTLHTGKGGRYRYYNCSIKARQGETGCKGRSIPMKNWTTSSPATSKTAFSNPSAWKRCSPHSLSAARTAPTGAASNSPN